MDKIVDIFEKRKHCESFMRPAHVLIALLYIGLRRLVYMAVGARGGQGGTPQLFDH